MTSKGLEYNYYYVATTSSNMTYKSHTTNYFLYIYLAAERTVCTVCRTVICNVYVDTRLMQPPCVVVTPLGICELSKKRSAVYNVLILLLCGNIKSDYHLHNTLKSISLYAKNGQMQ